MKPEGKYLFFDIETFSADERHNMAPRDFMRLFQWAWDDGPIRTTTDYDEARALLDSAPYLVGHNVFGFDLPAMYGNGSLVPLHRAQARRVVDTFILAMNLTPVPYSYTNRDGHKIFDAAKPERAMSYYALDNLAFQFDLPGKVGSLKELAKKHNPPKTLVKDLDYGLIPVDDPDFMAYSIGDIEAVRALFHHLMWVVSTTGFDREYLWRELELAAINARMTSNGILVGREECERIVAHQAERRERIVAQLHEDWDFPIPTEAKPMPWRSNVGKAAITKMLNTHGIHFGEHPEWESTDKGAPSFGGDVLKAITAGTEIEEEGIALAELQGQRSMAQLALDNMKADGRIHPDFTPIQRSGRWSSKPGISVWDGPNKAMFLADPGHVAVEFDFNNADARAVAALSGDREYAKRFETDEEGNPLYDGHNLNGEAMFGEEEYYSQLDKDGRPALRPVAKLAGHAMSYGIGSKKLAQNATAAARKAGVNRVFEQSDAFELIDAFHSRFKGVDRWKRRVVKDGESGTVTNAWGRRMVVESNWDEKRQRVVSRSYTQSPALHGQSTTREVMGDALIKITRLGGDWPFRIRSTIHDALWVCLPEEGVAEAAQTVVECMETEFHPPGGIPIQFPVGVGPLDAKNFRDAGH